MDPTSEVKNIRVENLRRAIGDSTIAAFARRYKFDAGYISQLLSPSNRAGHRDMGEKAAREFEEKIGLPPGSFDVPAKPKARFRPVGAVPLIPWDWAPRWPIASKLNEIPDDNYLRCPVAASDSTFALQVIDASMQAPAGRTYPIGCVVFVDPTRKVVSHSDGDVRILALVERTPVLRQLAFSGRDRVLLPLNQQFPVHTGPFTVLGRVLGAWIPE